MNFLKREISVSFRNDLITLKQVVELLVNVGYEPHISLEDLDRTEKQSTDKRLYYQVGVTGFAFANIMIFSLPGYFAPDAVEPTLRVTFKYFSLLLALPVIFYSAQDYFISAWNGLIHKGVNMDLPISLGIAALFLQSLYEILLTSGDGYLDSLSGLVFFLLIGKVFQKKTYDLLSFDRDYKSYFPLAVITRRDGKETSTPVTDLRLRDRVVLRNGELVPADSILMSGEARIDYSFVTGEADPVAKDVGDLIYAGGRQIGGVIEVEVVKEASQSYLTRLWNDDAFTEDRGGQITTLANRISVWFTLTVLSIAVAGAVYWSFDDSVSSILVFAAVLIVACPCALALSTPFTLGTSLRIFGRNSLFLKNVNVVEMMAKIDTIIFDKTGTLTGSQTAGVKFDGVVLSSDKLSMIRSVAHQSTHPQSARIFQSLKEAELKRVDNYVEEVGFGVGGVVDGHTVRIGSAAWVGEVPEDQKPLDSSGRVFVSIDGRYVGMFRIGTTFRAGLKGLLSSLTGYRIVMMSGDNERDRGQLEKLFPKSAELLFNRTPHDKLDYVKELQRKDRRTLMIGDGLNDAGALAKSDVGIAVTDDTSSFSPASDALISGDSLHKLGKFLRFSRISMRIIIASFILSFLYNFIGLGFAVTGQLSPIVSAILMPLSSISIVLFTTVTTQYFGKLNRL